MGVVQDNAQMRADAGRKFSDGRADVRRKLTVCTRTSSSGHTCCDCWNVFGGQGSHIGHDNKENTDGAADNATSHTLTTDYNTALKVAIFHSPNSIDLSTRLAVF